jgi:hypothetical protein
VLLFSEFLLTTDEIPSFNYRFRAARAALHSATAATTTSIE